MLKISNLGPLEFKEYIKNKRVFVCGAGRALESCLELYFNDKKIEAVIDSNSEKVGKEIVYENYKIKIINKTNFINKVNSIYDKTNIIILISSPIYGAEIVGELDLIHELDGIECFLQILIRNTKEKYPEYNFTVGKQKIPKKIHYIWVGGKPLPEDFRRNIETWGKYNPDYEIIRWDEANYDINANNYTRQAYESGALSFVSNYMRLDILYRHGGIYLDTDVEAIANFDKMLNDDMFMCMGCADRVNNGCGFGTVAGNRLIKNIMSAFESEEFIKNGKPSKKPCHTFLHPALRKYGFEIENKYQKVNGAVLYPAEVMSPLRIEGIDDWVTEKTVSIHKEAATWKSDKEKEAGSKISKLIKRIQN